MRKRYIFFVSIVLVFVLLYLFVYMFSGIQKDIENHIREEFNKEQHLVTERVAFQIEDMLNEANSEILFVRNPFAMIKLIEAIDSGNKKEIAFWRDGLERVYLPLLNSHPLYRSITFADEKGDEVVKVESNLMEYIHTMVGVNLKNLSDDLIFKETIKLNDGQIYMSRYHNVIKISTPVYHNSIKGIVVIGIDMDDINSLIFSVKYGAKSHTMLFTDKGNLLFCSRSLTEEQHKGEIEYILKNPSSNYTEIPESHGEKDILIAKSSLNINNEKWVVAIETTADEITGHIKKFEEKKQRLFIVLLLISAAFLSYFFKIGSDKIKAEIRAEEEIKTSKKLEAINKELTYSKERLERLNDELNTANEKLKNIDRQKTDFLNIVAHDLRTPLTSIRSYTDMLIMNKDKPETINKVFDEFLDVIRHEGIRLENLVNDYLDLAKIEAGLMIFKREAANIKMIINKSLAVYLGEAMAHDINLKSIVSKDLPLITADGGKLSQVVSNLLSNAIKYTPKGGTITVSAEEKGEYIEVCVEDSGSGISEEYHEKIFEKFTQVEDGKKRFKKGTGLGLPIVKYIVEHHDGKVWVESEKEKGAKFFFTLPIR